MIRNYNEYKYSGLEIFSYILRYEIFVGLIGLVFYKSFIAAILLNPLIYFLLKKKKDELIKKRKEVLLLQFKDAIISIKGALNAGYSIEKALRETLKDLGLIYQADSLIVKEFVYMNNLVEVNQTVENVISDFANRSQIEEIKNFADVMILAKRTGGNLINIIENTTNNISEKIELHRDMRTLFAAKLYESKIMKFMPFAIIIYLNIFSSDYLESLYRNPLGVIFMTFLLIIYFLATKWLEKILKIEI